MLASWAALAVVLAVAPGDGTVTIGGGTYRPLYPADPRAPETAVATFRLDARPVTRGEFAAFVAEHPEWQRGRVAEVFADPGYLARWTSPSTPDGRAAQPVVGVSWFAARAYCAAHAKRLPSADEWEYAARASATAADATGDPAWRAQILAWYARPSTDDLPDVGTGTPNVWGVYDLHGVVWEWVEDFNGTLVAADAREGGDAEQDRFCGSGALSAADVDDYASFMRIAFRSSLEARYTTANLGFRCARDEVSS
jgi:formylglycine-generating enzyme required for sulfatase activity